MAPSALATPHETVIHSFGQVGKTVDTQAGLIPGPGGAFYGTRSQGGQGRFSFAFKLTPPGTGQTAWTETVLHSFSFTGDGWFSSGNLIADESGALYGTTFYGGTGCQDINRCCTASVVPATVPGPQGP